MKECIGYSVASKYNLESLYNFISKKHTTTKYKNFLYIEKEKNHYIIFDYGVVVIWGANKTEGKKFITQIKKFEIQPNTKILEEELTYTEGNKQKIKILNDCVHINGKKNEEKIAISQAIAQSIQLDFFEEEIENTIENTKHIPKILSQKGRTKLSQRKISKMRGSLFIVKSEINLHYDLLDEPEFFWEYPELTDVYDTISQYLAVKTRIEVINKKLEIINEIFDMLADEQKHKHSALLEWIVIWLIVVEVLFTIFHDILKWF